MEELYAEERGSIKFCSMQDGPTCGPMNAKNHPTESYEQEVKLLYDTLLREKTVQKILSRDEYPTLKAIAGH